MSTAGTFFIYYFKNPGAFPLKLPGEKKKKLNPNFPLESSKFPQSSSKRTYNTWTGDGKSAGLRIANKQTEQKCRAYTKN